MSKYNESAAFAQHTMMRLLEESMEEDGITQYKLAQETGISKPTIARYFRLETDITLLNFLKICGALNIRPYLVPAELDDNKMNYIDL